MINGLLMIIIDDYWGLMDENWGDPYFRKPPVPKSDWCPCPSAPRNRGMRRRSIEEIHVILAGQSQGPEAPNLGFVSKMEEGPILGKLKNEENGWKWCQGMKFSGYSSTVEANPND